MRRIGTTAVRNPQRRYLAGFGRIQEEAWKSAVQAVICNGDNIASGNVAAMLLEGAARALDQAGMRRRSLRL